MSQFNVKATVDRNKTATLAQALEGDVAAAIRQWAALVLEKTLPHVPVDTGELRDSGHIEDRGALNVDVVFDTPYAGYVHFGTSKMAARPFLAEGQSEAAAEAGKIVAALKAQIEEQAS
jgi:HK97 gp10 family phage protein